MEEPFYLTAHITHFMYSYIGADYMVEDHIGNQRGNLLPSPSIFTLAAMDILYAPSQRQDNTHHIHCYTSDGALVTVIKAQ